MERVAHTLKAVAHPLRLRIIESLEHGELCVSELIDRLGAKPAITSQQLGLMKDRGVLESRRDGNRVYYRVSNPNVVRVIQCVRDHCDQTT
ncbi:MAG: winged helix-turn-helix transcriptional regulator [Phycisphaerae bacterium]|nr:winged helix-turn-helix transcriptional regulator [Phycisphaerae bacterium]